MIGSAKITKTNTTSSNYNTTNRNNQIKSTSNENPNNRIQTNVAKVNILNTLNSMTEKQRLHTRKLLELIRPDDNTNEQLKVLRDELTKKQNKLLEEKQNKAVNNTNPTLELIKFSNPLRSRIRSELSRVNLNTVKAIDVVVNTLIGMKDKSMQIIVIQNTILQINFHKSRHESLGASLVKTALKHNRNNEATTAGFATEGGEGVPSYDSNRMNNRSRTSMNELKRMIRNMSQSQPASQGIAPTIVKERVVYPETSVYSGYGRPKMMTEIDPHTKRPDKPPACVPQEKMPNGPVPLLEYANASDYTGVGSMLPAFVYDETYDKKHYTRLYSKEE